MENNDTIENEIKSYIDKFLYSYLSKMGISYDEHPKGFYTNYGRTNEGVYISIHITREAQPLTLLINEIQSRISKGDE